VYRIDLVNVKGDVNFLINNIFIILGFLNITLIKLV